MDDIDKKLSIEDTLKRANKKIEILKEKGRYGEAEKKQKELNEIKTKLLKEKKVKRIQKPVGQLLISQGQPSGPEEYKTKQVTRIPKGGAERYDTKSIQKIVKAQPSEKELIEQAAEKRVLQKVKDDPAILNRTIKQAKKNKNIKMLQKLNMIKESLKKTGKKAVKKVAPKAAKIIAAGASLGPISAFGEVLSSTQTGPKPGSMESNIEDPRRLPPEVEAKRSKMRREAMEEDTRESALERLVRRRAEQKRRGE